MRYTIIISCLLFSCRVFGLTVTDSNPSSQSILATPGQAIEIYFDDMIDITSVDNGTVMVFGRWSGPASATYAVGGFGNVLTITPDQDFFAGEYVSVQITSSLAAIDGGTMANGYSFGYWIRSLPGSMDLSDIGHLEVRLPGEEFIQCYGAYAGDLNNDGWPDLTVVNETAEDLRIFLSDQGSFSEFTIHDLPLGEKPSANEGTDLNGDGEIDLVIGNTQGDMVSRVLGSGDGLFGDEQIQTASQGVRGVAILDFEGDGDVDIATANRVGNNLSLFVNDGSGELGAGENLATPLSGETAIVAADMNEDGVMDLVIGGYLSDDVAVMLNDGQGTFTLQSQVASGDAPWMITMGDVNGDGHVDIAAASSGANSISVHFGDGQGNLSAMESYPTDNFPLAIDLGDLDGDGDLDMISSNYAGGTYSLYENAGDGTFGNLRTLDAEIAGSCAIFHDRDNDGVMDLTGIDELADVLVFFANTPNAIEDIEQETFHLYPNPVSDHFLVECEAAPKGRFLILLDIEGRQVDRMYLEAGARSLSWNSPKDSGTYFIIEEASQRPVVKFIKH